MILALARSSMRLRRVQVSSPQPYLGSSELSASLSKGGSSTILQAGLAEFLNLLCGSVGIANFAVSHSQFVMQTCFCDFIQRNLCLSKVGPSFSIIGILSEDIPENGKGRVGPVLLHVYLSQLREGKTIFRVCVNSCSQFLCGFGKAKVLR